METRVEKARRLVRETEVALQAALVELEITSLCDCGSPFVTLHNARCATLKSEVPRVRI